LTPSLTWGSASASPPNDNNSPPFQKSIFEEAIAEQEIPGASGVLNHRAQGTGQNEWYTPVEYIEAVRDVLGSIELDPASSDAERQAVALRIRAERKLGELLAKGPKAKGAAGNPKGRGAKIVRSHNGIT
jgi:hypothetical protein